MTPTFILANGMQPFIFVVPPLDLRIQTLQTMKTVDIIDFGEICVAGKEKVTKINFSTFLPNINSPFYSLKNPLLPSVGVELLKLWKIKRNKLTFLVPEFGVTYKCYIESFNYIFEERTGDITISLILCEAKEQNKITNSITGLFKR